MLRVSTAAKKSAVPVAIVALFILTSAALSGMEKQRMTYFAPTATVLNTRY